MTGVGIELSQTLVWTAKNIFLDPVNRQHFDNMLRKPFIRIDLRVRHNQNAHEDEEDVDA